MRPATTSERFESTLMEAMCHYIEANSGEPLTLEALAQQAGLSPGHFQRRFKAIIGVSPREYLESCRLKKLRRGLRKQSSVTGAIYEAGFGAPSRVYERVSSRLGMTPKTYQSGGQHLQISYASAMTPLGRVMMAATDRGLCFLQFGKKDSELLAALKSEYANADIHRMSGIHTKQFDAWMRALDDYLRGTGTSPDLPLDIQGTAFQMKVWKYLQTIPPGHTQSYTEVARTIGKPDAVRAVASACAKNRIAIVIPCHRVLRGDGSLAGYKWGLKRKQALIQLEKSSSATRVPQRHHRDDPTAHDA